MALAALILRLGPVSPAKTGLPVLLRFDRKSGHAGGRTQSKFVEDLAAEQAFLLEQLGVSVPKS